MLFTSIESYSIHRFSFRLEHLYGSLFHNITHDLARAEVSKIHKVP